VETIQVIILSLVQGLTEFLPISSSAHLIVVPKLANWPDQGLAFDVAVHIGTLTAVISYFRKEIAVMIVAWLASMTGKGSTPEARLAWFVLIGTIPVGLAGLFLKDYIEYLRSPVVIAFASIGFGLVLLYADKVPKQVRTEQSMTLKDCLIIGGFQALALIPGTSRSGATMTAAMLLGMTKEAAARFSFLLSIPVIVLSGLLVSKDLYESGEVIDWNAIILGFGLSAVSAFICIWLFLSFISRMGMLPFVIYRVLLGIVLLAIFY
jgi:undecaprenyl-diphosphatase